MILFRDKKFVAGIICLIFIVSLFILPVVTLAISSDDYLPIVQCGNSISDVGPTQYTQECDINAFIGMINRIINWIISIAGVIFAVSFIYGGFLYVTSEGNEGQSGKAKDILWSTLKGFVIILVAWVIVYTILNTLVTDKGDMLKDVTKFLEK